MKLKISVKDRYDIPYLDADGENIGDVSPKYLSGYKDIVHKYNIHSELFEALKDLVRAHETGMGKKPIQLRIDIAKYLIKKVSEEI